MAIAFKARMLSKWWAYWGGHIICHPTGILLQVNMGAIKNFTLTSGETLCLTGLLLRKKHFCFSVCECVCLFVSGGASLALENQQRPALPGQAVLGNGIAVLCPSPSAEAAARERQKPRGTNCPNGLWAVYSSHLKRARESGLILKLCIIEASDLMGSKLNPIFFLLTTPTLPSYISFCVSHPQILMVPAPMHSLTYYLFFWTLTQET